MKVKIVLSILVLLMLSKCKRLHDDKLTSIKKPYIGNEIRIDGFYYQLLSANEWNQIYFFYRNGTILEQYIKFPLGQDIGTITNENAQLDLGRSKTNWGIFSIFSKSIQFEKWYPSSGTVIHAYIRSGEILNDTTFHISQSIRSNGGESSDKDEMYHFKKFSPKPDSTNSFVP